MMTSKKFMEVFCRYSVNYMIECTLLIFSNNNLYIITIYILLLHIYYIYILYTVHHVLKCMSCHKAIVVITGRAHWFHDYIYIFIHIYVRRRFVKIEI